MERMRMENIKRMSAQENKGSIPVSFIVDLYIGVVTVLRNQYNKTLQRFKYPTNKMDIHGVRFILYIVCKI